MDFDQFFKAEFDHHKTVLAATRKSLGEPFAQLADRCSQALRNGGKILFFGNGGSASDAQHLATELTVRYRHPRRALPAMALATDGSALTAIGNDMGFEHVFARQIEALGRPGDVALGITTSGRSPNVTRGLMQARDLGMTAAALCGRDGGELRGVADPLLIVPADSTARIQEMHILIGQALCAALEIDLGLVQP